MQMTQQGLGSGFGGVGFGGAAASGMRSQFGLGAQGSTLNQNLSSDLALLPSYATQQNLIIFNKTFIQDRYIIG